MQVSKHTSYLIRTIDSHKALMFTLIFPAFFFGWQMGKAKGARLGRMVLHVLRLTLLTTFTRTKKYLDVLR